MKKTLLQLNSSVEFVHAEGLALGEAERTAGIARARQAIERLDRDATPEHLAA